MEACVDEREREGERFRSNHKKNWKRTGNKKTPKKTALSFQLALAAFWRTSLAAPCHRCRAKVGQSAHSCGSVLRYSSQLGFQTELSVPLTIEEIIFAVSHLTLYLRPFPVNVLWSGCIKTRCSCRVLTRSAARWILKTNCIDVIADDHRRRDLVRDFTATKLNETQKHNQK